MQACRQSPSLRTLSLRAVVKQYCSRPVQMRGQEQTAIMLCWCWCCCIIPISLGMMQPCDVLSEG